MKFHLSGTSLSGLPVDEYAVTDSSGTAHFEDVLIGSGYVLSEVDTGIQYVVPDDQTATVEWNKVTEKAFHNILKKWNAVITKSDGETARHRVTPASRVLFTVSIRAISSSTPTRPTAPVSLLLSITPADLIGQSVN